MVWPPGAPASTVRLAAGSRRPFARNGPVAWNLIGCARVPRSTSMSSWSFRSALSMRCLKARSSTCVASPPPPPQDESITAAARGRTTHSGRRSERGTGRSVLVPRRPARNSGRRSMLEKPMPIRRGSLTALAAVLAAFAMAAGPAHAARVIVVDGDQAVRVDDPPAPNPGQAGLGQPPPGRPHATLASRSSRRRARAVSRTLRRALRQHRISPARYRSYRSAYGRALRVRRRLRGARRAQLGYVIAVAERLALAHRLIPSRMPMVFLELRRNTQYWPSRRYPGVRDWVRFRGSEVLFQYFPGRGLQLHPLGTFKRANALHGFCVKGGGPCRPDKLRRLLDAMRSLAVRRSRRFIAWEYMFDFGGGA